MMRYSISIVAGVLMLCGSAYAQFYNPATSVLSNNPPVVTSVGANDLTPIVPGGSAQPGQSFINTNQLANYALTQAGAISGNALIGGDFGTNLFQRGASVVFTGSATVAYSAADRWFVWSGTNTGLTTASYTSSVPQSYSKALSVRRTTSQNGVVQSCVGQVISTINSVQFQGKTAELGFWAKPQAGFSDANDALQVYVAYGTGTDEGSNYMAYTVNGGGATGWTGGALAGNVTVPLTPIASPVWTHYSVTANIPSTATEVGVALCWTPVGTGAPANDGFYLAGVQLVPNNAYSGLTSGTGTLQSNTALSKPFQHRFGVQELGYQLAYYQRFTEAVGVILATGFCPTGAHESALFPLAGPMRAAPTVSFTAGGLTWETLLVATTTPSAFVSPTATAVSSLGTAVVSGSVNAGAVTITDTAACVVGSPIYLYGTNTTGVISFSAEL